jgi:uncharacterized sulfatase
MHQKGSLSEKLDKMYFGPRPKEELYDLEEDPREMNNLAQDPKYRDVKQRMRSALYSKMKEQRDMGLIPEPELEKQGLEKGSKYFILKNDTARITQILKTIEDGEENNAEALIEDLHAPMPSVRYWSATWLGVNGTEKAIPNLKAHLEDPSASVRIASALALCRLSECRSGLSTLENELDNSNLIAEMYALRALEKIGYKAMPLKERIKEEKNSRYEFSRRLATRIYRYLSK